MTTPQICCLVNYVDIYDETDNNLIPLNCDNNKLKY